MEELWGPLAAGVRRTGSPSSMTRRWSLEKSLLRTGPLC